MSSPSMYLFFIKYAFHTNAEKKIQKWCKKCYRRLALGKSVLGHYGTHWHFGSVCSVRVDYERLRILRVLGGRRGIWERTPFLHVDRSAGQYNRSHLQKSYSVTVETHARCFQTWLDNENPKLNFPEATQLKDHFRVLLNNFPIFGSHFWII